LDNLKLGLAAAKSSRKYQTKSLNFSDVEATLKRQGLLEWWSTAAVMIRMCNSQVMLLDEPTEGIQPSIVQEIDETLRRINRKGESIMVVEQKIDFARHLAQKFFIMEKGSIVNGKFNLTDSSASIFAV